jgi:Regulator of ribonuclease activity B
VLLQDWEDRPLVIDTNTGNHVRKAVTLRRKSDLVIEVKDDGEDTGGTYNSPSVGLRLDGLLHRKVPCGPPDVDREALEKLRDNGFDFSKSRLIEFTVHFQSWPPQRGAMRLLRYDYPSVAFCTVEESEAGYLEFQVYALLSYELVTNTQRYVTELMAPYHGVCSSWSVVASFSNFG